MTAQLDIDRLLDDFLADGAHQLSDHVLDAALGDIESTRQRRAWRVPRRSDMPTPLRLLAAAALLAAALGGAFLLGGNLRQTTPPEPAPSPRPSTTTEVTPIELGAALNGQWVSYSPAVFGSQAGDYVMTLSNEAGLLIHAPDGREIFLGTFGSRQPDGRVLLGTTDRCDSPGTYSYETSADHLNMTIDVVSDTCADRVELLASTWIRTSIGDTLAPNQRYTYDFEPRISFAIPDAFRDAAGGPPRVSVPTIHNDRDIQIDAEDYFADINAGVHVQIDRCDQDRGRGYLPTSLQDFVAWNQAATGVTVSDPVTTTIGGHAAVYVDVTPAADCPNGRVNANCSCIPSTGLVIGMVERTWAVDVDGKVLVIQFHDDDPPWLGLTPERLAVAQEFIDSIQFE
jgi:hypothetical protein